MTKGRSKGRIARGLALASLCGFAIAAACSMDGPTEPAPVQSEAETAARTELTEAAARERLVTLTDEMVVLLERLRGTSLLGERLLLPRTPARRSDAAAAETRSVIGQLVEAQERARLESKQPEELEVMLDGRDRVLLAAREALEKAQAEIEEVRIEDADTLVLLRKVPQEGGRRIRLRGQRLTTGQEPLVFIDGVLASPQRMQELSPDRIESIEVIKGAAAARLYGEQGASGVIQINTK